MYILITLLSLVIPILQPTIADPQYTYPQPPIPDTKATVNSSSFLLSPDFVISSTPTTREYWWSIDAVAGNPDGYTRQIYAVQGQFPGPLIEANEGDRIVVHVDNHLDIGQTIHWHGMLMNGTQWMDGVPGISQCPIPPGGSFTYDFTVHNQYGTYWWHSHSVNTMADGLVGALIIHSVNDPSKKGADFDEEMVVIIQDWMDVQSQTIVEALHTVDGYRGTAIPPQANAILINGVGQTNCSNSDIQDHNEPCLPPTPTEIQVPVNKKVKLRLINAGTYQMARISIDRHPYDVVEADDTPLSGPNGMHEIPIAIGQRYSIIIDTNQGVVGDSFWFRAHAVLSCLPDGYTQLGLAVLRYVDEYGNSNSSVSPVTQAWDDLQGAAALCADLEVDEKLTHSPRLDQYVPQTALTTNVMSSSLGSFVDVNGHSFGGFFFNNVSYQAQNQDPLLRTYAQGHQANASLIATASFPNIGGGDVIINNLAVEFDISHPYHLHGAPFWIVARGEGVMDAKGVMGLDLNQVDPVQRDVIQIQGGHYAVLRMLTDIPGVWPLHCHIGWHLSLGKLAAMIVQPDAIKGISLPSDWSSLCTGPVDDIGYGRRSFADDLAALQNRVEERDTVGSWPSRIGGRD